MAISLTKIKDKKTKKAASFSKQKEMAIQIGRIADRLKLHVEITVKAK